MNIIQESAMKTIISILGTLLILATVGLILQRSKINTMQSEWDELVIRVSKLSDEIEGYIKETGILCGKRKEMILECQKQLDDTVKALDESNKLADKQNDALGECISDYSKAVDGLIETSKKLKQCKAKSKSKMRKRNENSNTR